ncbi:MAG: hypothetical protein IJJ14_04495 [Coriobacteriales bacterium]|nr:hypothetical protein [Coriobacteriales bacterium]
MDKQEQLERIRSTSKPISVIARIVEIFAWIGVVVTWVAVIFVGFAGADALDEAALEELNYGFGLGGFKVFTNLPVDIGPLALLVAIAVLTSITLGLLIALMRYIRKTFDLIGTGETPFSSDVVKNMRIVAILLTIIMLPNSVLGAVIVALTMWALMAIFEYGATLQTESDETI